MSSIGDFMRKLSTRKTKQKNTPNHKRSASSSDVAQNQNQNWQTPGRTFNSNSQQNIPYCLRNNQNQGPSAQAKKSDQNSSAGGFSTNSLPRTNRSEGYYRGTPRVVDQPAAYNQPKVVYQSNSKNPPYQNGQLEFKKAEAYTNYPLNNSDAYAQNPSGAYAANPVQFQGNATTNYPRNSGYSGFSGQQQTNQNYRQNTGLNYGGSAYRSDEVVDYRGSTGQNNYQSMGGFVQANTYSVPPAPVPATYSTGDFNNNNTDVVYDQYGNYQPNNYQQSNHGNQKNQGKARASLRKNARNLASAESWSLLNVTLQKNGRGLGMKIVGGVNSPDFEHLDGSIVIRQILEGGAAADNNLLREGDVITVVNGVSLVGVDHDTAVLALKNSGEYLDMTIRRKRTSEDKLLIEVEYRRVPGCGLGFSISGGVGDQEFTGDDSIYIAKITSGGIAEREGSMKVGDKILEVNGNSLMHVTRNRAVQLLTSHPTTVKLLLERKQNNFAVGTITPSATGTLTSSQQRSPRLMSAASDSAAIYSSVQKPSNVYGSVREPRQIRLARRANQGFGFTIVGGWDNEGIFVATITPGGLADQDGQLKKGDQILMVNNANLRQATHNEAVSMLKSNDVINLIVQYRPAELKLLEQRKLMGIPNPRESMEPQRYQ